MQTNLLDEARRQADVCNACRYCEGYCSVFPALHAKRVFSDGDIVHLANLCHNCRGCYYACQYTAPHEFALNLPKALSEVRRASWEDFAWPQPVARIFHNSGVALALATVLGLAIVIVVIQSWPSRYGAGFYEVMSHGAMLSVFIPAFLFPLVSLGISQWHYWRAVGGGRPSWPVFRAAFESAARMKDLAGGHGDGCNFEDEDRFSHARRWAHQAVMYGFLLCFLSTVSGTVLHYAFDMPAPYPFWSLPKLFGVPGGLLMVIGTVWMAALKLRSDRNLGDSSAWGGEMGFIVLLFVIAVTGLVLYWLRETAFMPALLALHLGSVLGFFLLMPFTKMAHGAYRMTALVRDACRK